MNDPNLPLKDHQDKDDNCLKEEKRQKNTGIKLNIGDRQISLKFGCSAFLCLLLLIYFITVLPGVISHYFSELDNQSIIVAIGLGLLIVVIIFVSALLSNSTSVTNAEKDEFTRVNNEYYIRKQLADKKKANTSADADTGRCSICGAKVSRTNTNCPKCGRIIR